MVGRDKRSHGLTTCGGKVCVYDAAQDAWSLEISADHPWKQQNDIKDEIFLEGESALYHIGDRGPVATVWEMSYATGRWKELPEIKMPLQPSFGAVKGRSLFIHGRNTIKDPPYASQFFEYKLPPE